MITVREAKEKFQGICVPVVTVLQEDGSVDIDGIQSNIQWMIDQGAKQGNRRYHKKNAKTYIQQASKILNTDQFESYNVVF